MKHSFLMILMVFALGTPLMAQDEIPIDTLNPTISDISYSLGVLMATNVQSQNINNLDIEALTQGMKDVLQGMETRFTPEKCNQIFSTFMTTRQAIQFEEIRRAGEAFLAENSKRPEITVTESGLQYEILQDTVGPKPSATDRVKVHYTGTLVDGTVFDSSVERGEPETFTANQLIAGWTEGLQLMSVGSKYKMYIPFDLAYGTRGAGNRIPPYSVIIFEVELLSIE